MKRVTYKSSGVNIKKGNEFVEGIKKLAKSTQGSNTFAGIGSFGGLFDLDKRKYKNPVLVSSTDGVGTKLLIAQKLGIHHTVGIDLVAMCVNDVAVTGAEPLFFLDYISTGKIQQRVLKDIVKGIAKGCKQAGYSLIGGETAEMPGMYSPGEYDLAGFCVGVVDKNNIIDGKNIKPGDLILGLSSSGLHSNGYSLVRKALTFEDIKNNVKDILKPTRIYVKPIVSLVKAGGNKKKPLVKGLAHITGGSFKDKIGRILPPGTGAEIKKNSWKKSRIFHLIQEKGNVTESEMYKVFNMGIGMTAVVSKRNLKKAKNLLSKQQVKSQVIGEIVKSKKKVNLV